jgi:hypothetical protein
MPSVVGIDVLSSGLIFTSLYIGREGRNLAFYKDDNSVL